MRVLLLALLLCLPMAARCAEAQPLAKDPVIEQRMIALAADLRCLVCQNESLAGSPASLAEDLRQEIRDMMRQGKSDQEIVAFLTQRYGDFVLYRPPLQPKTWLLWFGPFALLAGAGSGFYLYLRRRSRRLQEGGSAP